MGGKEGLSRLFENGNQRILSGLVKLDFWEIAPTAHKFFLTGGTKGLIFGTAFSLGQKLWHRTKESKESKEADSNCK